MLTACGEMTYSPYTVNVGNYNINQVNLSRILLGADRFEAKSISYKIAVISDTHDYYDGLKKQVAYINAHQEEYEFVVVTGDMSNVGLVEEMELTKSILDKLAIPYITTVGNHDLLINGKTVYKRVFGKDTYAFEYKNTKFILFNNNNWESSPNIPDLSWVESELISNNNPFLIMLSHVAPNDSARFSAAQIQQWKSAVNRYGVDYYIHGHDHNPSEGSFGDAKKITVGASVKGVLFELKVENTGVSHEFINL